MSSPELVRAAASERSESEAREAMALVAEIRADFLERCGLHSLAYEENRRAASLRKGRVE